MYLVWIEVRVEDDHGVRSVEVDANATSPCGQKVDKGVRPGSVELVNALLPERARCVTVLREEVSDLKNESRDASPVGDV